MQEQRRPAAMRGLFALGFTRTATVATTRDVEQGGASAPPGGAGGPYGGHGRASSEDT